MILFPCNVLKTSMLQSSGWCTIYEVTGDVTSYRVLHIKSLATSISGLKVHWFDGLLVRWIAGSMDRWFNGSMDGWFSGSLVRWFDGSVVQWFSGSLVQWINGPMDR